MIVIKILFKYGNAMEICMWASQAALVVKNLHANVGGVRDVHSIPGSGRSPRGHSSILAWRIPWTEETGRLWSVGSQRVGHD